MFNVRLLALVPRARFFVVSSVVARWLALLCQVAVFVWLGMLVGALAGAGSSTGAGAVAVVVGASGLDVRRLTIADPSASLTWEALVVPVVCAVAFFLMRALAKWCADRAGSIAAARLSELVFAGALGLGEAIVLVMLSCGFFLPMREFGSLFHTGMNVNPVIDEATANIDAESERYLLAAMQKIALSKTVIIVSHRLSVLRHADEILVMCA